MKHRLFIAINLPETLKEKLERFLVELGKRNKNLPISWVNSLGLHLTLHFLGYIEKERIPRIEEILTHVAKEYEPFIIKLGGIDAFPNLSSPRIIFLDCQEIGANQAKSIQKTAGAKLEQAGFDVESRPWQEHITLGRVKARCHPNFPQVEISGSEFKVSSIELMESGLAPQGAKYSIVKSFELE